MADVIKVLGPPGTGKTTYLMTRMEGALEDGYKPVEIGFLTFTKKATNEAIERACAKFNLTPRDLPYFRTLHSLAYTMLGVRHGELVQYAHLQELGKRVGMRLSGKMDMDDDTLGGNAGDRMLFLENLARIRKVPLRQIWEEQNDQELSWDTLKRVADEYRVFKEARGIIDFTDLLVKYVNHPTKPRFKILFLDEAQDLAPLQWDLVQQLVQNSEIVVIAGDDDQAIFQWAGADVQSFIDFKAKFTQTLDRSYRIPGKVHALSQVITRRIKTRLPKEFKPQPWPGELFYHNELAQVDMREGEWLLLCRNRHQVMQLAEHCRECYLPYEAPGRTPLASEQLKAITYWERQRKGDELMKEQADIVAKYAHPKAAKSLPWYQALTKIGSADVAYYRGLRQRNESLFQKPRIRISTIHGAKGGEADNVVLMTDLAARNEEAMRKDPDQEHRVFYVGVTRAKRALHIIRPQTNIGYTI